MSLVTAARHELARMSCQPSRITASSSCDTNLSRPGIYIWVPDAKTRAHLASAIV